MQPHLNSAFQSSSQSRFVAPHSSAKNLLGSGSCCRMARRKQARPTRGGKVVSNADQLSSDIPNALEGSGKEQQDLRKRKGSVVGPGTSVACTEVLAPELDKEGGFEVAEVCLVNTSASSKCTEDTSAGKSLQLRLQVAGEGKVRIGGWQELSTQDVTVEIVGPGKETPALVLLSGQLDCPDAAVSGLVYLIKQAYFTLQSRPWSEGCVSGRVGVFITRKTFESCELLLESNTRPTWTKAIQSVIAWLRPELAAETLTTVGRNGWLQKQTDCTGEVSGDKGKADEGLELQSGREKLQGEFDPTALYDAVKPTRNEPCLEMAFPELLPELRPYQRRAAFWMVQRERGAGTGHGPSLCHRKESCGTQSGNPGCTPASMAESDRIFDHPLWIAVDSLDGLSHFYYNPYSLAKRSGLRRSKIPSDVVTLAFCIGLGIDHSGYVSMEPHNFQSYVHGGILADEMGLGKTVELLACILANPNRSASKSGAAKAAKEVQAQLARRKRERIECSCGAIHEDDSYTGSWVQCDLCDAWQHASCVGYASSSNEQEECQYSAVSSGQQLKKANGKRGREYGALVNNQNPRQKRQRKTSGFVSSKNTKDSLIVEDDRCTFVCGTCAELIGSVEVKGECGATLVVCPTPILQQWQDEISRHVRAGALQVVVYEGVQKGMSIGSNVQTDTEMNGRLGVKVVGAHDLAAADLVLTTYDTLRADLFHVLPDTLSNNRVSLRQPKRYRVVPTPLTKLQWWRVCLDEAQMVESSTARATEMAMCLRATHRWCVSGTPIQRGLDDLYGLLRFLGAQPFDNYRWWTLALKQPYEEGKQGAIKALHDLFRGLMWRSSKLQIMDELNLPPQEDRLSWLRFSPVEAHFYRQQHERCAIKAREVIAKYKQGSSLAPHPSERRRSARTTADLAEVPLAESSTVPVVVKEMERVSNLGGTVVDTNESTSLGCHERRVGAVKATGAVPEITVADPPGLDTKGNDKGDRCTADDATNPNGLPGECEDRALTHSEAAKLLNHLLRLRQACCHPQVGSSGIRSLQRSPMTMDEILEVLVDKARVEAEDAQRSLIGALNGLAALAIIEKDSALAVSIYREALASTEENSDDIRVDPLQKLHTLHNLAEVLAEDQLQTVGFGDQEAGQGSENDTAQRNTGKSHNPLGAPVNLQGSNSDSGSSKFVRAKIPRTLRDGLLVKQCEDIKARYMAAFHGKLASVREDFQTASKQVQEAERDCAAAGGTMWWLDILASVEQHGDRGLELVKKIRDQLLESDHLGESGNMGRIKHRNTSSLALRFRDIAGLRFVLQRELDAMNCGRTDLLHCLTDLDARMDKPDAPDIERAGQCSRCQPTMEGPLCSHCEAEEVFQLHDPLLQPSGLEGEVINRLTENASIENLQGRWLRSVGEVWNMQAYENRLFFLKVTATGDEVVSAEDTIRAQHTSLAHKRIGVNNSGIRGNQTANEDVERGVRYKGPASALVTRAPSETERILSIVKGHSKLIHGALAAKKHLQSVEAMRKEYAQSRLLALAQREVLYALDELNMATTRLQLRYHGHERQSEIDNLFKLHPEEIPQRNVQLTGEKFMALDDFTRAKGQLRYLKGLKSARRKAVMDAQRALKKTNDNLSTSSNDITFQGRSVENGEPQTEGWARVEEEACPVCHEKLGSQLMVLPCGHLLCCKCLMALVERATVPHGTKSQKRIMCPTCRHRANVGEIAFVDNGSEKLGMGSIVGQFEGEEEDEEHTLSVMGSYGTKLEAVVRRILWVKSKDPEAKVLLFSQWQDVLDVVEHALAANRITFARIKERGATEMGTRKLNAALEKFRGTTRVPSPAMSKTDKARVEPVQVLLLPIKQGANGLNLVEAQHVILMEPLLNPGAEAQAINRVHRIGQCHSTFVHRFIISDTVEESIYKLRRRKAHTTTGLAGSVRHSKKGDGYTLTLRDVNALFSSESEDGNTADQLQPAGLMGNLRSLPPAAAAAAAAEARLISNRTLQD